MSEQLEDCRAVSNRDPPPSLPRRFFVTLLFVRMKARRVNHLFLRRSVAKEDTVVGIPYSANDEQCPKDQGNIMMADRPLFYDRSYFKPGKPLRAPRPFLQRRGLSLSQVLLQCDGLEACALLFRPLSIPGISLQYPFSRCFLRVYSPVRAACYWSPSLVPEPLVLRPIILAPSSPTSLLYCIFFLPSPPPVDSPTTPLIMTRSLWLAHYAPQDP